VSAPPQVAILADDLTGALDAAAPFAARGFAARAAVRPGLPAPSAEVVAVNAASRHLPPEAAAATAAREGARLAALRPKLLFKKIDSTLRGQVVAETAALLGVCGRATAVVAPAFPAQGRTVVGGELLVRGAPLRETPFARDARSPAPMEPLWALFRRLSAEVPDAASEADMAAIARDVLARAPSVLAVGSAGLARALAAALPARPRPARPRAAGRIAVVVGSRAEEARRQAERLDGAAVLLRPPSRDGDPDAVASALAARAALEDVAAFVVVGGDTTAALLAALGVEVLEVLDELLPGAPLCRLPDGRLLATKAGAFGDDDALRRIVTELR